MPILDPLALMLAVDTIKWLGNQGIDYLSKSDYDDYEKELSRVIYNSTETYKQQYVSITKSGKTHFCDSQIILSELLKFRLSTNPNSDDVFNAIKSDPRVEIPTEKEMSRFLEIFSENVKNSTKLVKLNIENNYKEEIFNISNELKNVFAAITDLKNDGPVELIEEWSKRLDEVTSNIEKFKPKTALDILEILEHRISEKGISITDALKGKIIYLKAVCLNELHTGEIDRKVAEEFILAYNYFPDSIEIKMNAGLSYLVLGETIKAKKIATEILRKEEYHSGAWALMLFLTDKDFTSFLSGIPSHVKNKREFKARVGYWIINKRYVGTISELDELGFNLDVHDENEPPSITSKNKWYWTTVIKYLINKLYEQNPMLSSTGFDSKMIDDTRFNYTLSILRKLATAVDGSEVEENYAWYKFELLYMDYVLEHDKHSVPFIETTFRKIKNKLLVEVIQMAQVYNSFGTDDYIKKAIKVIDDFGEDKNEILSLFISYNHLRLKNPIESIKSFKNYLNQHTFINERVFHNLIQYLNSLQQQSSEAVCDIKEVVSSKVFKPTILKDLFEILSTYSNEPIKTDDEILEKIKNEINSDSETMRFYVGIAFYINEKPNKVAMYLGDKVNKTKVSDELKLYCRALFQGDSDKLELLSILETWRKTQPLDYDLIRVELQIREAQRKWDIFVEIAKQALEIFHGDELLIYSLFYGFDNLSDTEGIKNNISLIENKEFRNEHYGIAIANILLKAGLPEVAIELHYKTASKRSNVQARSSYITSIMNYPQNLFKDFPSVEIGRFVEYKFEDNSEILFINEENVQTKIVKSLLNKAVGEFAIVDKTPLSGKQIKVQVVRVMNKYAALLREIFKEAENPLSGYRVEVVKFEDSDIESLNKAMIETFGALGSSQKEFREKEFEKYYKGINSFTEVACSIFDKNRFDAYFHLTSSMGKRFIAVSPSICRRELLNDECIFVLDVTSVCLFFQLSKELGLTFKHKFIISASLRRELVCLITETKMNPEAKLSVNITMDGVTPYFPQEGYKEGRLIFLEEILQWIDNNCEIDQVDESLNLILQIKSKSQSNDEFLYENVDNRLLVDRPNHILLTNDTFYYKLLKAGTDQVISPELYLKKFQNEKILECSAFMLKCNYVGISIYFEVLQEEFINMIGNSENKFSLCLENFSFSWNPNLEHAKIIVRFLKWLNLSNAFNIERKNQTTFALFLSALRNAPLAFGLSLRDEMQREFALLPDIKSQIQLILLDALKMINSSNKNS